jgi:hypothetical protein
MQVVDMNVPCALAITRLAGTLIQVHHSLTTHAQASSLALSRSSMTQLLGAMKAQPTTARPIAVRAINNVMIMAASFGFSMRRCRLVGARLGRFDSAPMRRALNLAEPDLVRSESIHAGTLDFFAAEPGYPGSLRCT